MKTKTVSLYTLGCRTNQSETAAIQGRFEKSGYKIVDFSTPADLAVINTCTVTEKGDSDCRKLINKLCRINPDVKIALIGCQAQVQKERLSGSPNIKWVVGNGKKMEIESIISQETENSSTEIIIPPISRRPFKVYPQSINTKNTRANIKIQDGCDFFCSYCEVPYARGRSRSRDFANIENEARNLSKAGVKEIVITGINVGTYNNEGKKLLDVIDLFEQIEGIQRIRISSIELRTIPKNLIKIMSRKTKLCRYLHIPLQNANNEILGMMNRKYSFDEFKSLISFAHEAIPNICIGSDVIVGFPKETKIMFNDSVDKIRSLPLNYLHVFSYSERNMAKSKNFDNKVPKDETSRRSKILRELSIKKRHGFFKSIIGTTQKVLFEQKKGGYWNGLTDNYVRVKVKSDRNLSNIFAYVQLNRTEGQAIVGTLDYKKSL